MFYGNHPLYHHYCLLQDINFASRCKQTYCSVKHRVEFGPEHTPDSTSQYPRRLSSFQRKLNLFNRLNRYMKIFLNSHPPVKSVQTNTKIDHKLHMNGHLSPAMTPNNSAHQPHKMCTEKARSKSRKKLPPALLLHPPLNGQSHMTPKEYNRPRSSTTISSKPRTQHPNKPGNDIETSLLTNSGDFIPSKVKSAAESSNNLEYLQAVSTFCINNSPSDKVSHLKLQQTRIRQLQILQQKLLEDKQRTNLEFQLPSDKDWMIVYRELRQEKGHTITIRRTLQHVHDEQIVINQSIENAHIHQTHEDTVKILTEFVRRLQCPQSYRSVSEHLAGGEGKKALILEKTDLVVTKTQQIQAALDFQFLKLDNADFWNYRVYRDLVTSPAREIMDPCQEKKGCLKMILKKRYYRMMSRLIMRFNDRK